MPCSLTDAANIRGNNTGFTRNHILLQFPHCSLSLPSIRSNDMLFSKEQTQNKTHNSLLLWLSLGEFRSRRTAIQTTLKKLTKKKPTTKFLFSNKNRAAPCSVSVCCNLSQTTNHRIALKIVYHSVLSVTSALPLMFDGQKCSDFPNANTTSHRLRRVSAFHQTVQRCSFVDVSSSVPLVMRIGDVRVCLCFARR